MASALRERFILLYQKHIEREGSVELLNWLEKTDFFTAPASTRFHGAEPEGLVMHSLNVFDIMMQRNEREQSESEESIAICALLHDLCKTEFYKQTMRNVKNDETGVWEKVPYYAIEDKFPYGHGEKSVYLIERHMRLKISEAMAIRWHMGGFDDNARLGGFALSQAFSKYPIAVKLHLADLEASYLVEGYHEPKNK